MMSDDQDIQSRLRVSTAHLRPLLPVVAVVCILLTLWLAFNGWQQLRDASRIQALQQARGLAVDGIVRALQTETGRMSERLASDRVQAALASGDLVLARIELKSDWPHAESAEVLSVGLADAYAGLPKTGFGRVAVAEAALAANQPVARIVRDSGATKLLVDAPARVNGELVGVASVVLPSTRATGALSSATVDRHSYLALRQGDFTVLERGDTKLNDSAETLAVKIPHSDMRIAAAMPDTTSAAFGLGPFAVFGVALVMFGIALLAAIAMRRGFGVPHDDEEDEAAAPTLAEAVEMAPPDDDKDGTERIKIDPYKAPPVQIDRSIFRAYDIRGVVGKTLDAGVAELIGHAVGSLMHEQGLNEIVVGRDGRHSGPDLVAGLTEGLRKAGCNVIDIGLAPTPLVYFGGFLLRTGCGIAVTGSHNPPEYNGFKIVVGGQTLSGDAVIDLHSRIAEDRLHTARMPGTVSQRDIGDDYVSRIASDVQIDKPLKVVVDAGNGVAGELGPRVLEAIGADVTPLYCEIDGDFPNHHPDPSEPENLSDLVKMVVRLDADLGIAFDGDGDRLGVVTRDGEIIYADRLLMLFAADVLERNPGAVIVYDVKCTGRLPGQILRHGGSPLMWKTGHSLIKAKMHETEAELAGEMSGHFFFAERWYGFDDGIYAAARLLEILAARSEPPIEVLQALPNGVSTPEIKVAAPNDDPHSFVEHFELSAKFEGARRSTIDGVRVDWPDGWGLVRASNTTPVLVMRFDADSQEALERIQALFRERLLAVDPELDLPF